MWSSAYVRHSAVLSVLPSQEKVSKSDLDTAQCMHALLGNTQECMLLKVVFIC